MAGPIHKNYRRNHGIIDYRALGFLGDIPKHSPDLVLRRLKVPLYVAYNENGEEIFSYVLVNEFAWAILKSTAYRKWIIARLNLSCTHHKDADPLELLQRINEEFVGRKVDQLAKRREANREAWAKSRASRPFVASGDSSRPLETDGPHQEPSQSPASECSPAP